MPSLTAAKASAINEAVTPPEGVGEGTRKEAQQTMYAAIWITE